MSDLILFIWIVGLVYTIIRLYCRIEDIVDFLLVCLASVFLWPIILGILDETK